MNYQVKLFHWPERGDHVILIARGFVGIDGFKRTFRNSIRLRDYFNKQSNTSDVLIF